MMRTDEEKFVSVTDCPLLKNRVIRFAVTILPLFLLLYFAGSALAEGVTAELGKRIPPRPIAEVSTILPNWFPIMFFYNIDLMNESEQSSLLRIRQGLSEFDLSYFDVTDKTSAIQYFTARKDIGCVVVDWGVFEGKGKEAAGFFQYIRDRNPTLPLFIMTDQEEVLQIPNAVYKNITGYLWSMDDSPAFLSGVIRKATLDYHEKILPPMFKALVEFVNTGDYNWAVPGHSGGSGMLRSPAGTAFFNFFGENIFRGDVSTTIPSVGDALLHTGAVGQAEKDAAEIFGADYTFFVLNGSSNSNRIVFSGIVTEGDVVLQDRNCHKSAMQACILTQGRPVYLKPTRNNLGIIGPIHPSEFTAASVRAKIKEAGYQGVSPDVKPMLSIVTNPTYDGLLCNTNAVKKRLAGHVRNMHFDEAWFAYGCSHPIYRTRYAMEDVPGMTAEMPPVFAVQSVHKLMTAFSQGGVLHIKNGSERKIDWDRFNEAFLMHSSTSPFTPLIASIDTCAKMMEQPGGHYLIQTILEDSVNFRKKVAQIHRAEQERGSWFFKPWQPDRVTADCKYGKVANKDFLEVDNAVLTGCSACWELNPGASWHGFTNLPAGYAMLDPLKVTLQSPGLNLDGTMDENGIPMLVVEAFLRQNHIFSEKVGFYLDLILFSPGVTKSKSGTMIAKLMDFKNAYDAKAPLTKVLPELVRKHPKVYQGMTLPELCRKMHVFFKGNDLVTLMNGAFDVLPEIVMEPSEAYVKLIRGKTEYVPVAELEGRIAAVMVTPYPPGIPLIMPGERLTSKNTSLIRFLKMLQDLDNKFPDFGLHVHGVKTESNGGQKTYMVDCIKEDLG
ncbi:MAG: lysine decarboxylase [Deltaproteobacteria bacterium]|nr:lysine decarboxylase [Deltaproteobacteria bacterium]